MKAVLVTGLPGSGKSIVVEAAKKLGIPVVCMGDIVREEAIKRGLEINREVLGRLSRELRQKFGQDIIAKLTYEKVRGIRANVCLIDGVRSWAEVEYFKNKFENVIIIAVHAPPRIRFLRLLSRGREDDPKTWEEFIERDERELSMGIGKVIALSDYIILNYRKKKEEVLEEAIKLLKEVLEHGS